MQLVSIFWEWESSSWDSIHSLFQLWERIQFAIQSEGSHERAHRRETASLRGLWKGLRKGHPSDSSYAGKMSRSGNFTLGMIVFKLAVNLQASFLLTASSTENLGNWLNLSSTPQVHTGEKPYKCNIENCDRAYAHGTDLKRHRRSQHGIFTKTFECPICSKIFYENKFLKKHLNVHKEKS